MNLKTTLRGRGIEVTGGALPVAAYTPVIVSERFAFVSGQLPSVDGKLVYKGALGRDVSIERGVEAARLCAENLLIALAGELDRGGYDFVKFDTLRGYVACDASFELHSKVVDGASKFLIEVLGDAGRHARAAVGVSSLPLGAPVEVEAMVEIAKSGG